MVLVSALVFLFCLYKSYEDYPVLWNTLLLVYLLAILISTGITQGYGR